MQQRLTGNRDRDCGALIHLPCAREGRRRYADDGERLLIEFELLADDGRVGAEPFLPELMAEYDYRCGAFPVVLSSDCPSQNRLYAEPAVIAAGHDLSADDLCLPANHGIHLT